MADEHISPESSASGTPETVSSSSQSSDSPSFDSQSSDSIPGAPRRRRVYESSLLPERKHRRMSPWIVIPGLLIILGGLFYYLSAAQHAHRFITTQGKIVYASDAGSPGVFHIWIANSDGTGARQLTHGLSSDIDPVFTPEGSQVAFVSNRSASVNQIFLMDADGQNVIQITHNTGSKSAPQFAPSSNSLLAFTSAGLLETASTNTQETSILLPTAALKAHTQTGDTSTGSTVIDSFVWSPAKTVDQQALAAVEDNSEVQMLALAPPQGSDPIETANGQPDGPPIAAADQMTLGWSPDGHTVAVAMQGIKNYPGGEASGIILFDSQGHVVHQSPVVLIKGNTIGPRQPAYSPDGTQILFSVVSQPDLAHQKPLGLFLAPVDGSSPPRPVFHGPAENALFTPDGKSILFLMKRPDEKHDLFRVNLDGSGLQRISNGQSDIASAAFSLQGAK